MKIGSVVKRQFYQLSLSAKKPLGEVFLSEEERNRLEVFLKEDLSRSPEIQTQGTMTGEEAFQLLYEAGFRLTSSASVGGCRATATIEHFFVKEFSVYFIEEDKRN